MAERYVVVAVLDREVNDSYYPKRKYRTKVQFCRVARHTILWQIWHEARVYGCSVEGRWGQPRHADCPNLLPVWTNANRGCLATELLVSLSKAWHVLRSALHISRNDPSRSIRMDLVLNVFNLPCVQWQNWRGTFYASISYPVAVYCQNMKMNLKILRCAPSSPSTVSHSSHFS